MNAAGLIVFYMEKDAIEIRILRQHWVQDNGVFDSEDLCSHGELYIRVGSHVISDASHGSWCLTAAGLYLLRTLYEEYSIGQYPSHQLIPCCGHFLIPNEEGQNRVTIIGCSNGIECHVQHSEQEVIWILENGASGKISKMQYRSMILSFAEEVESFYGSLQNKIIPDDPFILQGLEQFWTEWATLKSLPNF